MTTERQFDPNRQNAHASTGPRTPEGKAKVSRNAEKHGLFSRHAVIEGEDAAEFDALAKGMRQELAPIGDLQDLLADRTIVAAWKLSRITSLESAAFAFTPDKGREAIIEMLNWGSNGPVPPGWKAFKSESTQHMLGPLTRYEVQAERMLYKALNQLRSLQTLPQAPAGRA